METATLHDRLLDDARSYDPAEHTRSLLAPYRDVLLLWRAKFMSYEQIAATLTRHGVKVSPASVGIFCRRSFTRAEILGERKRFEDRAAHRPAAALPGPALPRADTKPPPASALPGKRGPKIARDNY
jgi:hypothetical protein